MKTVKLKDDLYCTFKRNLTKINGSTSFKNNVSCKYNNDLVLDYNVDFEEMGSAYIDEDRNYYICPKGRHHVLKDNRVEKIHLKQMKPKEFVDEGDWELNCYMQFIKEKQKIFVFYLNKEDYFYQINPNSDEITKVGTTDYKIISYRWTTEESNGEFPMYAIIEKGKQVGIRRLNFKDLDSSPRIEEDDKSYNYLFTITESNFIGFLNNDLKNSKFYYISYVPGSIDIRSGYVNNLSEISKPDSFIITNNTESPLKFIDNIVLENIKFINYTKYAYYKS